MTDSQRNAQKRYKAKFKYLKIAFTPDQMQDLTAYCEMRCVAKSAFCTELILKKIYGGNIMEAKEMKKSEAFEIKFAGGNTRIIAKKYSKFEALEAMHREALDYQEFQRWQMEMQGYCSADITWQEVADAYGYCLDRIKEEEEI